MPVAERNSGYAAGVAGECYPHCVHPPTCLFTSLPLSHTRSGVRQVTLSASDTDVRGEYSSEARQAAADYASIV